MKINSSYLNLHGNYLFSTIAKKVADFQTANPEKEVLRLGIGDVTLPLCSAVTDAIKKATDEMGNASTFHGYGPELGYAFLREKLRDYYTGFSVALSADEIFVSDGAKSDLGNILDILSVENKVLIPDPVYPAYMDANIMLGRHIDTALGNKANGFKPVPDESYDADIIYMCSPNNPTGAVYTRDELTAWVEYANRKHALILFDAAYESFISSSDLPHSIYEIEGAKTCAIEICSFSKTAGFTGTRCGYTVVPHALVFDGTELNSLWSRRQSTKFNGVPYIVQRGAEAVFSAEGQKQIRANIAYYMQNAKIMHDGLSEVGIWMCGGENSPYIWMECPKGLLSWDFFDLLLNEQQVVGTPGAGFGTGGEGFFRLTAFGNREKTITAVERMKKLISSL